MDKLCINCKHFDCNSLRNRTYLCARGIKDGVNLVTGERQAEGRLLQCQTERYNVGEAYCGKSGRFFEDKGVEDE